MFSSLLMLSASAPAKTSSSEDTNHASASSSTASTSKSTDAFSPYRKITTDRAKRLTRIFNDLITNNEDFKKLWIEVNHNVHQPIVIIPSPPFGHERYIERANLEIKITCPPDCPKEFEEKTTSFPHSFKIRVNAEQLRTDSEIARSILFETCNAALWPKHHELDQQAENSMVNMVEFAEKRELIEHEALQLANKISATILPSSEILPFKTHLDVQVQDGHFQNAENQFLKIKQTKHRRTLSSYS